MVGSTRRFGILGFCHSDVRLVSPNSYMLFHGREVGFTNGLGWIHGMVRCGLDATVS